MEFYPKNSHAFFQIDHIDNIRENYISIGAFENEYSRGINGNITKISKRHNKYTITLCLEPMIYKYVSFYPDDDSEIIMQIISDMVNV